MKILLCKSHFAGPVSGSDETLVAYATHLHRIRDVLGPAGVRFLVPKPGDFARLILELADDPELRSRAGAENRKRVREHYDSRRMCKETVALLNSAFSA